MSSEEPGREWETIEAEEGSAGEPQQAELARPRGGETMSDEELDERQRELRTERRWAGPELEDEPATRGAPDEVPDVEPTETEDAPAEASSES